LISEYPRERAISWMVTFCSPRRARARAAKKRSLISRNEVPSAFRTRCSFRLPMLSLSDTASSDRSPSTSWVRRASVTTSSIVGGCATPMRDGRSLSKTISLGAGGLGFGTRRSEVRTAIAGRWAPRRIVVPTRSSNVAALVCPSSVISIQSGVQVGPRKKCTALARMGMAASSICRWPPPDGKPDLNPMTRTLPSHVNQGRWRDASGSIAQ
jgi:hypothetical protein